MSGSCSWASSFVLRHNWTPKSQRFPEKKVPPERELSRRSGVFGAVWFAPESARGHARSLASKCVGDMRQPASARGGNVVAKDAIRQTRPDRVKNRAIRARQRAIGRELRRMYDEITREPVPDEFLDLLRKIDDESDPGVEK